MATISSSKKAHNLDSQFRNKEEAKLRLSALCPLFFVVGFVLFYETESHSVDKGGLQLIKIHMPLPPKC